jgi:hypothetical protein
MKLLHPVLAWQRFLQSAIDSMPVSWLNGAVSWLLPVGLAAQVSRFCWPVGLVALPWPLVFVFEVFAPVGLAVVGFTVGTLVQALSKAIRLVLPWLGTWDAGEEKRRHLMVVSTMPKTKDWQSAFAVQRA